CWLAGRQLVPQAPSGARARGSRRCGLTEAREQRTGSDRVSRGAPFFGNSAQGEKSASRLGLCRPVGGGRGSAVRRVSSVKVARTGCPVRLPCPLGPCERGTASAIPTFFTKPTARTERNTQVSLRPLCASCQS